MAIGGGRPCSPIGCGEIIESIRSPSYVVPTMVIPIQQKDGTYGEQRWVGREGCAPAESNGRLKLLSSSSGKIETKRWIHDAPRKEKSSA